MEIKRISELKQKFHPNQKLRAWRASHTFGGTTKLKNLKILGFSKTNFYYIAAGIAALALVAAVGAGLGIKSSLRKAKVQGARQGVVGQQVITRRTQTKVRTLLSDGQTILTTETSSFITTFQRGGGVTSIIATNSDGEETMVPASISIMTNSVGELETVTFVASSIVITNSDGVSEETVIFGDPTVISSDGLQIVTTVFNDLVVTTDESGSSVTSIKSPTPAAAPGESEATETAAGSEGATATTDSDGATPTGDTTATPTGEASSDTTSAEATGGDSSSAAGSSSSSSASSSTSAASSSSSARASSGGSSGGGGEEFEGEATFYAPGLGSCGTDATDADFVAALSKVLFDATGATNSNSNPYCGRKALVKAAGGSKKRWEDIGNITSWGIARDKRISRRSVVALNKGGQDMPTPSRNGSEYMLGDSEYKLGDGIEEGPPMPGITPAPDPRDSWKRQVGGGGVTITVVDRCPVCKQYDLDLSPAAYDAIGDQDEGRIAIKWKWLD